MFQFSVFSVKKTKMYKQKSISHSIQARKN